MSTSRNPSMDLGLILRSGLYNTLFYIVTPLVLILALPTLALPRRITMKAAMMTQSRLCQWLLKVVVGLDVEVRGRENLPDGPALIASKHQSMWEAFALSPLLKDPSFILKHELVYIPVLGWYIQKFRLIKVRRGRGGDTLKQMLAEAAPRVDEGRHILIFPEGTRRAPGAEPAYKHGVAALYQDLDIPCIPVALNSGLYWPRRKFLRYRGKIIVEFLPPIAPGLPIRTFKRKLQDCIEQASNQLIDEAAIASDPPPLARALHAARRQDGQIDV